MRGVDKFFVILRVVLALSIPCAVRSSPEKEGVPDEQRHFSAEDGGVRHTMPLPRDVLKILSQTETVKALWKGTEIPRGGIPRSWFSGSVVHLAGVDERDLIVQGADAMAGANVTTFWIFRHGTKGYSLVLEVAALDLTAENHRTNGLLDVTARSATGSEVFASYFQFSGNQSRYVEIKSTREMIGEPR
jgi:hypothetical protein